MSFRTGVSHIKLAFVRLGYGDSGRQSEGCSVADLAGAREAADHNALFDKTPLYYQDGDTESITEKVLLATHVLVSPFSHKVRIPKKRYLELL